MRLGGIVAFIVALTAACHQPAACAAEGVQPHPLPLIPEPTHIVPGRGVVKFSSLMVQSDSTKGARDVAALLRTELDHKGQGLTVGNVTLSMCRECAPEPAGYLLTISDSGIDIVAPRAEGLFWGSRTLLQLVNHANAPLMLPHVRIEDSPRFAYRGLHLDVSRHFFSVAQVKQYIDILASYKLNIFHWHLTDDHGFRLPVPKWPRLTEVGAFREDRRDEPFNTPSDERSAVPASRPRYGGFYTHDDIREVVAYAGARHVVIVPEVDVPGHAQAAAAAYPELTCASHTTYEVASGLVYPFSHPLCPCKESTFAFVKDVIDVLVDLFPGPYIHIGGDEVDTTSWQAPVCAQSRGESAGPGHLQAGFMQKVARLVRERGRTPIVWQESAEGGAPEHGVTMAWLSAEAASVAARKGDQAVVADSSAFYFDKPNEAVGAGLASVASVYNYNPVPSGLSGHAAANILGVEAALWTEQLQTWKQIERALLPRLGAFAEVAWTAPNRRSFASFTARTVQQLPHLASHHEIFLPTPIGLPAKRVFLGATSVNIESPAAGIEVHYTLDGAEPTMASARSRGPLMIKGSTHVRARSFLTASPLVKSDVVEARFELQALASPLTSRQVGGAGLTCTIRSGRAKRVGNIANLSVESVKTCAGPQIPAGMETRTAFAITFTGTVLVKGSGLHTFCLDSNDGSQLLVAGRLVVDNDGIHGARRLCGDVALHSGVHELQLNYFQDKGTASLQVTHGFGQGSALVALPAGAYSLGGPVPANARQSVENRDTVDVWGTWEERIQTPPVATGENPFADTTVTAQVITPSKGHIKIDGFCDAENGTLYKARFMPSETGLHTYNIKVVRKGAVLAFREGTFLARQSAQRGPVRVDKDFPFHFIWEGTGEHYFWNGTTAYLLLGWDDQKIEEIIKRLADLGVNRIRLGLSVRWKPGTWGVQPSAAKPSFTTYLSPWVPARPDDIEKPQFDVTRFHLPFWRKLERALAIARARNVILSLVFYADGFRPGTDPFGTTRMGGADEQRYYKYAIDRLAAFSNVMWDLANEYRLFRNDAWADTMGRFVKTHDPYKHLTSVHGHSDFRFRTAPWADVALYQQWDDCGSYTFMAQNRRVQELLGRPIPQVNEEFGYEDLYAGIGCGWSGPLLQAPARNAENRRKIAWSVAMAGGYQTSGERAVPSSQDASPSAGGWLNGAGNDNMRLFLGYRPMIDFFTRFDWWRLEPHSELAGPGTKPVLAELGKRYVVRLDKGGNVSLRLEHGLYRALWFNPRTGKDTNIGQVRGLAWTSPEAPDNGDWMLLIEKLP